MKYDDLKQIGNAPEKGWLLIYFREAVMLSPYQTLDDVRDTVGHQDVLEIHLFDQKREYRAVVTRSPRFPGGVIEHIADFSEDANPDEIYCEELSIDAVTLDKSHCDGNYKLRVIHHLTYNQDQMIEFDDFRLAMEEQ